MKKATLLFLFIISIFMVSAQMKNPDFAFPKTVSKEAEADLAKAEKDKDAHAAINALIRLSVADCLIDPAKLQSIIKDTEGTAAKFADDKLYGLFQAWLAYLYNSFYDMDRWKYNRRELPLSPLPDNLTEWSGEQFRIHIKGLCMSSTASTGLKDIALSDYTDIITCDKLAAIYFTSLQDFVYGNAINILDDIYSGKDSEKLAQQAAATSEPGSAAAILWHWVSAKYSYDFDEYIALLTPQIHNEYAGLTVWQAGSKVDKNNISDTQKYLEIAEQYLKDFPNTPFKNNILNIISSCKAMNVEANYPKYCAPGHPVDVKVTNTNAAHYYIDIYYTGEENYNNGNKNVKKALKALKPWKTLEVNSTLAVPFREDTTLSVMIDKPGYYYVLPRLASGNSDNDSYIQPMRCLGVFPLAISYPEQSLMVSLNPYTGAPIADASVWLRKNRATQYVNAGKSNAQGITDLTKALNEQSYYNTRIDINGKQYIFPDINIYKRNTTPDREAYQASVLTSRAIYHPGETVDALVIMSRTYTDTDSSEITEVCANKQLKISLKDVNSQNVGDTIVETDAYGRASVQFLIPTDGLTGYYNIEASEDNTKGNVYYGRFMVSDYKMPDFEVNIDETACDVPTPGSVSIKGNAVSYSGMPISDAKVTLNLKKAEWGWWKWQNTGESIYSSEVNTDANGKFAIIIPDSVLTDKKSLYSAAIDVVSVTGSTADASTAFALAKKYLISVVAGKDINGEIPFTPNIKVYSPDGSEADIPLVWSISNDTDTIAGGVFDGEINLKEIRPASYTLTIAAADPTLADATDTQITVYNRASGIVPDDAVLYIPIKQYTADNSGKVKIEYANSKADTYIYYCIGNDNATTSLKMIKADAGYHILEIELPTGNIDSKVYLYTLKDCNLTSATVDIKAIKESKLTIEGESFRDNLIPQSAETWHIRIVDANGNPVQSALALDMYNKALESLAPHSFNILKPVIWNNRQISSNYLNNYNSNIRVTQNITPLKTVWMVYPAFNLYGYSLGGMAVRDMNGVMVRGTKLMSKASSDEIIYSAAPAYGKFEADLAEEAAEESEADTDAGNNEYAHTTFDYRDSEVPLAIWAPMLTTDAQGNIDYSFTVPNANTTWRLRAVAWSKDLEIGTLMRDFVASKPVMVQPNLPRFLRQGDSATILASVMNNTDTIQSVTTTVEIFDPLTQELRVSKTFNQTIGAKESDKVAVNLYVDEDATAIGYRIRSTNGTFADGEQNVIRILSSEAALIETTPFYLNPGDSVYTTTLPSVHDARLSLTFCENPVWTVVSALPGMRQEISEYANSAAAALFSAAVSRGIIKDNPAIGDALKQWMQNPSDSALISMLHKNEDLKIAVLNSTPWVQAAKSDNERMANLAMIFNDTDVEKSIASATKILAKLQNTDGGWSWGKWSEKSSVWVTANVLDLLGQLRHFGWLPADSNLNDMIDRAVKYYDANVENTDMLYCLVRPMFGAEISANGQKVIKATVSDIKKNWKKMSDPAYKAMAAQALFINGEKNTALKVMKSVSEFGVYTKGQGLTFPSVNALYNYGILLNAYAIILPESKEVDGLRQQLIVRKQATDWGSSVVTTQVVKAILSTGTSWTVDASGAEVKVADKVIKPEGAIQEATGYMRADLSDYAGKTLTVTTSAVGPAYGAVYAQLSQRMEEVKANGCDDLDIEKQLFVRRGDDWAVADNLKVGDRVKVQLTIHSKRNMQYVEIIDERPAAFEPIEQLPGWMWSEGVGFYRENRDAQTNLHVVYMSPGTYLLTYEMNVSLAGDFTSGIATIQSQYAPELSAHSSGSLIKVE